MSVSSCCCKGCRLGLVAGFKKVRCKRLTIKFWTVLSVEQTNPNQRSNAGSFLTGLRAKGGRDARTTPGKKAKALGLAEQHLRLS